MPVCVITHNGLPPAQGGRRIGYAYIGVTKRGSLIYFPDAAVANWELCQRMAQRAKLLAQAEEEKRNAMSFKEWMTLPMARYRWNECSSCGVQCDKKKTRGRDVVVCPDCRKTLRPYSSSL